MRIAVLSGKGGAGKTLVSVNIASAIGEAVTYIDADTEEPNGDIFMKPTDVTREDVFVTLPEWHSDACTGCKRCVDFCAFHALAYVGNRLMIFDDVCHSCGGCSLVCPNNAFGERTRVVGGVTHGRHGDIDVLQGVLNTGEASGMPIIRQLLSAKHSQDVVIDCPPGSACGVMECIKDADYCVLVAEPTLFGVHNLNMVCELAKLFGKKKGVVLNKCVDGEDIAEQYCIEHDLPVLGRIAWSNSLGAMIGSGKIAVEESKEYREIFTDIVEKIREEVAQ